MSLVTRNKLEQGVHQRKENTCHTSLILQTNLVRSVSLLLMFGINEPRHEKINVLVSDLVQHKPGVTATENG